MKGSEHTWPTDEEIVKGCLEYGSPTRYATEGLGIAASTLRHRMLKHPELKKLIYDALGQQALKSTKLTVVPPSPGDDVSELEKLRQEIKEKDRALAKARSDDVREARVIDAITEHLDSKSSKYKPGPRALSRKQSRHEFVLLWSDIHAGEMVSAEETNGANHYDWDVMLRRHQRLLDGVLSYKEHAGFPVDTLHICALGDGLSGSIHDELRETNQVPLAEATVQFGLDAADWLEQFVPHFRQIRFAGVVGNHPRESRKPQAKRKFSNADWTSYQIMQQRLKGHESITFDIPKAQKHPIMVCNRRIMLAHGDSVGPSAMVGVPTGGIVRHVAKVSNQYASMGKPIDHHCFGHFHEVNIYRGKRIIVNGNIKGPDEYGLDRFGEADPPMQLLLTFNERRGLSAINYIDLDDEAMA